MNAESWISFDLLPGAITASYGLLSLALLMAGYRLFQGPDVTDRIVALDLLGVVALGFLVVFAVETNRFVYLDIALALSVILFLGTVALARYLERSCLPPNPSGPGPSAESEPPDPAGRSAASPGPTQGGQRRAGP